MTDDAFDRSASRSLWRRALAQPAGSDYWRSLQAHAPVTERASQRGVELPPSSFDRPAIERRELMQLMGAGVVMTALAGCTEPPRERILPYGRAPSAVQPGVPNYYATSFVLDGYATGVLARSNEGRPTKIQGNPQHPASLGATRPLEEASILDLYDPARVRAPRSGQGPLDWPAALARLTAQVRRGAPPWFVLYPQSSPTLGAWCDRIRERLPGARFTFDSPLPTSHAATQTLFGRKLDAQYDFTRADVVLDVGSDFLSSLPMSLRWSRDFAARRRATEPGERMNRLYTLEAAPSPSGSLADHRLALSALETGKLLACLLGELLAHGGDRVAADGLGGAPRADASPHAAWIRALASDLLGARGASAVVVGPGMPLSCQVLALYLNVLLGNVGRTLSFTVSALLEERSGESLSDLVSAIQAQQVGSVVILEANPVFTASPELELARWLAKVPTTAQLTARLDETSKSCRWLLPQSHYLESWGDARAYDGTFSVVQPLIHPLYASKSPLELLAALAGETARSGHELVQDSWRKRAGADFDERRDRLLQLGFDPASGPAPVEVTPSRDALAQALSSLLTARAGAGLELQLQASALHDGRFAQNAWLQELPHPITKQTWGNAARLGPATAKQHGIEDSQLVELELAGRRLRLPALVQTGHAEGAVSVELGYGRSAGGLAAGIGANGYALARGGSQRSFVRVSALEASEELARTQRAFGQHSRPLALATSLSSYRRHPEFTAPERKRQLSLLPSDQYRGTQWAMTIDTTICTGCSSCVVACQAENNVPVVGKAGVQRGREMHWLRIDRYELDGPAVSVVNQPMLCQHCEKAPCEYVCPVNATVHSPDGLNEMVYNRCIGTRFCSNNCPYKVRRFNWFKYTDAAPVARMQRNPAVTVRERGVMEKCTFCVQRLRSAEAGARLERRGLREGEAQTACQQACPTGAIQFGSLEHRQAAVVTWRNTPRRYEVLHELNTQPRVQYLAKIQNDNPALTEPE